MENWKAGLNMNKEKTPHVKYNKYVKRQEKKTKILLKN